MGVPERELLRRMDEIDWSAAPTKVRSDFDTLRAADAELVRLERLEDANGAWGGVAAVGAAVAGGFGVTAFVLSTVSRAATTTPAIPVLWGLAIAGLLLIVIAFVRFVIRREDYREVWGRSDVVALRRLTVVRLTETNWVRRQLQAAARAERKRGDEVLAQHVAKMDALGRELTRKNAVR